MQRLKADASRDDMLKRIFVRCLPQRIVTVITGSLGGNLDVVIAEADRAWTAAAPSAAVSVSAVTGPPSRGKRVGHYQGRRPTGPQMTTLTLCVFHKKFGNSARKCAPGCSRWNEERPRESRVNQVEESLDGEDCVGRSPSAAGPSRPRPAKLGMIIDQISRRRCLIDTGSQVSLWPPSSSASKITSSRVRLTAANGTPIKAYGQQTRKIKIGGRFYSFGFLIAQIPRPILGINFLETLEMAVDLRNRQLLHSGTSTRFSPCLLTKKLLC